MVSALISRIVILLFGTLYPAYASYKAVKTKNVKEYVKWMMYWIVFAFFTCIETFADIFIAWVPFYYEMKILFVLWLLSPATKGASILYRKFLHPQLAKREKEIDTYLAKASDQGYSAILSLGSKGFNYATNVVLTTAIKGQAKITDHIRKSYSMNDLTGGDPQRRLHTDDSEPELDDDTDNRLIEESYREEMMEKERRMSATEGDIDDQENRPRRRRAASKEDPGLYRVEETEEEAMAKGTRKTYSHKEAYHYGTLPRQKARTRSSIRKN